MFKKTLVSGLILLSFASLSFAQGESITITTYYPSPYGSYNSLQTDKLGVGDNNNDGSLTSADTPTTTGEVWIKGKVGIGTTGPSYLLHMASSATGGTTFGIQNTSAGGTTAAIVSTGSASASGAGDISIEAPIGTTRMLIQSTDGNVGIGTASPTEKLQVNGALSSTLYSSSWSQGVSRAILDFSGSEVRIVHAAGTSGVSKPIAFYIGGGQRMIINTAGDVGIGTASPSVPLDVQGSVWNAWANGYVGLNVAGDIATGGSIRMPGGGRVGIRTNNPAVPLDVQGTEWNAWANGNVGLNVAGDIATGGSIRMPGGGRAGIRTNNPVCPLDVRGSEVVNVGGVWRNVGINAAGDISTGQCFRAWSGGNYCDISEYIFMRKEDKIEPGDVVVIDDEIDGQLKLSSKEYDSTVAGVVSSEDTVVFAAGSSEGGKKLLALAGQINTKVTTINGSIKRGDLLTTSSVSGHAMKATDKERLSGAIVGKAMQPFSGGPNGKTTGKILALVTLQ